jgi:hypothetical protein
VWIGWETGRKEKPKFLGLCYMTRLLALLYKKTTQTPVRAPAATTFCRSAN